MKKSSNNLEHVELRGEVRSADLDAGQFSLRLDDGTRIVAGFTTEQEQTIIEALREHAKRCLRLTGSAEVTRTGRIKRIASVESLAVEPAKLVKPGAASKPIWEFMLELGKSIPKEEWARVPTDLARNLHHYLHGAPKVKD